VNAPEDCPQDPHTSMRKQTQIPKSTKTPNDMDKLRKFLELDRKVLRFYCIWDDRDQMFGEVRKFILHVSGRRELSSFYFCALMTMSAEYTHVTARHGSVVFFPSDGRLIIMKFNLSLSSEPCMWRWHKTILHSL